MLALVASIHVLSTARDQETKTWMVGTSPTMTPKAVVTAQTHFAMKPASVISFSCFASSAFRKETKASPSR